MGVFVTMNPYLKERNELPDNLKSLFRPIFFIAADYNLMCEIRLLSDGKINFLRFIIKFKIHLFRLQ